MGEEEKNKKLGESFSKMVNDFGEAFSKIFEDPELKKKAKELGKSASESTKVLGDRFKDEEVKQKFKDFGKSAKKFGENIGKYFKDEEEKSEKKMNNTDDLEIVEDEIDNSYSGGGRIAGYSIAIAWNLIFLIFFNFFYKYIAYYEYEVINDVGVWNRYTLVTEDFRLWLPILTIAIAVSIVGNIILIISDKYFLRQIINLITNIFGIAAVGTLLSLFPFDFSVIPNVDLTNILTPIITVVLILIIIGLSIGTIVSLIKLIVYAVKKRQ